MKYRIGLDIGIGSVGWAVISAEQDGHPARIEDFGTRIFKSGEEEKTSKSLCNIRRIDRGVRRLERRRSFRKKMLYNHLSSIGFINRTFNDDLADCKDVDVYELKVKGIYKKLSPAELYKCLVHTCNHRGYRDFYEPDEDDPEAGMNESAANAFEKAFKESGKKTVSEYLISEKSENGFVKYRNRDGGEIPYLLIRRKLLQDEVSRMLDKQREYYPCLTDINIERIITIVFNQRDFEDGPGNPDDKDRRYHGFIEALGRCPFYKEEERGFRSTVIADVYAVTNTVSQYRFVDINTGEYVLKPDAAKEIVDYLLLNANLTKTDIKKILKGFNCELRSSENSDDKALGKSIKYLKTAKVCVENAGFDWKDMISQNQFDLENPSLLHRIGELSSKYQTPRRRKEEMRKEGIDPKLISAFSEKKINGTAAASYRYMCDAIKAFTEGDIYGNFQANFIKKAEEEAPSVKHFKLPPSVIEDPEVRDNRVVFKAINETRKIVNAIIDIYGSPEDIVVEVASELGKSLQKRNEETKKQRANEKANDSIIKEIAELLSIEVEKVTGAMIERYKLFKEQEGKCAYSLKELGELKSVVLNRNKEYEIDHIVPYSLILDNTLNNKALVFTSENQKKGQRTPLMYLNAEKREAYLSFVNYMFSRKNNSIGKKKLEYYTLKTIFSEEAEEKLNAWKSRNINDTRYITKYIAGLLERSLLFSGDKKQHVFTVKGSVTQKFRREWFKDSVWGQNEKDRSTYLNHALDAVVAANLTKPYIEIGSDALKLISIYKSHRGQVTPEYNEYLEKCIVKMKKYYGFDEEYTRRILLRTGRAPSYVPRLVDEVRVRFYDESEDLFNKSIQKLYGNEAEFINPPHIPVTSQKQEKKFKGCIADANPLKIVEINGVPHKIKRESVAKIKSKDIDKLYTDDKSLKELLSSILSGKDDNYSVEKYLSDNSLDYLRNQNGTIIRKVSLDSGVVTNYYRKNISEDNYTNLGMLKYYCVEVYKDANGGLKTCGIRYVDIINKGKKLFRKEGSLPDDYFSHVMYLFANDYIKVYSRDNELKFEGYYKSVKTISRSEFYVLPANSNEAIVKSISKSDTVRKYNVDILGKIGGMVKCSVPLQCIKEKNYQ